MILWANDLDEELGLDKALKSAPGRGGYSTHWGAHGPPCWSPDGSRVAMCFLAKARRNGHLRFGLVIATTDGRIERLIDLEKLGVSFMGQIDWK